ncbi:MAG: TM0106 family RecB-like putative nuclease [Patescibacteria group bacterium]
MSLHPDYLTATDFYRFLQCPHWPYFERFATEQQKKEFKRQMTDAERNRLENGIAHEKDVVTALFEASRVHEAALTRDAEKDAEATLRLMQEGVPFIYQGTLTSGDWTGRPDLLERCEGDSNLGAWHYIPIDVKSTHSLEKYQKLQLVFYATLLERMQGRFPAEASIVNSDGERLSFTPGDCVLEFEEFAAELERLRAGERPDLVLRKSCFDTGPWGLMCKRLCEAERDIALLYNVDVRKLRALRSLGIRTIDDAAEMDPVSLDGSAPGLRLHGLEVAKRQAQALKDKLVIVREAVALPTEGLEIHFDIESDPPLDVDYLYGFLVRGKEGDVYRSFVAERPEDEGKMWAGFLVWIETLPEVFSVYHYSPYEFIRLGVLERRYGGSPALERFREHMFDLKEITSSSIIFPLYFYGLKYIAPFLGFRWTGTVTGGGQSVDEFEKFLETGDHKILEAIMLYNEEDVRATAYLKDWLVKYAKEKTMYEEEYPWSSRTM